MTETANNAQLTSLASPLAGRRVLVTRPRAQSGTLLDLLRRAGAKPVEYPAIAIEPADDYSALDAALRTLHTYDWMIFTSVNTITQIERRWRYLDLSWAALDGLAVAAIGPKTAAALRERGVAVAFMPHEYMGTAIAAGLPLQPGQRVLLARADIADRHLAEGLRARGAVVDEFVAYRTVPAAEGASQLRRRLESGEIDAVTFTSASTVRNLCALLGDAAGALADVDVACIGPVTAAAARECGLEPRVVAREYTVEGLVAGLAAYYSSGP